MDTSTHSRSKALVLAAVIALACVSVTPSFAKDIKHVAKKPMPVATLNFCDKQCGTEFSATTARDLVIYTSWTNLPAGSQLQQVTLLLPNGDVYQKFETKLSGSSLEPVKGRGAWSRYPTVTNVVPVAGSWIQQRSLTGVWTVEVRLDGKLVKKGSFTIKQ